MLTGQLEARFRAALGEQATAARQDSISFAVEFTRLLARVIPDEVNDEARVAMTRAIEARTDLSPDEIEVLLSMALRPEERSAIGEDELRAFGSRFGPAAEEALRQAADEEIDLSGFAERYGAAEGLLLLDALFSVCAVDGVIDPVEISRLTRSAQQLGIDASLVGSLFRKHDLRHAAGDFRFELTERSYVLGRSPGIAIQLPDPQVADRHCQLVRAANGWRVVDLQSGRPTLVNGAPVSTAPLNPGDQLRVGSYTLSLDARGETLTAFGSRSFSALSVRHLQRTIGTTKLLDDVSFTVFSGEVIAVVGPSGAGKTTLLNAIAGIAPADAGDVLLDGQSFHKLLAADRSIVGSVPQDDVIHPELTVEESLYFSARLRLPSDTTEPVLRQEVDRVLRELELERIRGNRIGDAVRRGISGGQRKRVNLGQELLTRSTRVLFLDEPTSGLDPQTAQDIVSRIRQLADDGRIVFLVTHDVSPTIMSMVDHLLVLAPGGRQAWFGPPAEANAYFGVQSPDEIFARLPDATPEVWGARYREAAAYRKLVRTREHLLGLDGIAPSAPERLSRPRRSARRQLVTLTRRYIAVKRRDVGGLAVLLSQAPILGLAMWVVFPDPDPATLFMLILSSLWFGASGSVRELIAERPIWRREARVGLRVGPYLASKVLVMGALVLTQCAMLVGLCYAMLGMSSFGFSFFGLLGVCTLTGWVGMALGLLVSSIFASSEAAVGTLPLLLIPQITFGGLIVKVKEMSLLAKAISYLMIVRYGFEASIKTGQSLAQPGRFGNERATKDITAFLFDLGFRSASADDQGLPVLALVGVLTLFLTTFLLLAAAFTARSRDGD